MIYKIDLDHMQDVLQLLELQQLAYAIEAVRIGFKEAPPLLDSPQMLRDSGETFFGYYEGGRLLGVIAFIQGTKELTLCRMMVHPDFFRRGIAGELLSYVESFAPPGSKITVITGTNNEPAVNLYEKHGYEPVQMQLLAPGITMTRLEKQIPYIYGE